MNDDGDEDEEKDENLERLNSALLESLKGVDTTSFKAPTESDLSTTNYAHRRRKPVMPRHVISAKTAKESIVTDIGFVQILEKLDFNSVQQIEISGELFHVGDFAVSLGKQTKPIIGIDVHSFIEVHYEPCNKTTATGILKEFVGILLGIGDGDLESFSIEWAASRDDQSPPVLYSFAHLADQYVRMLSRIRLLSIE